MLKKINRISSRKEFLEIKNKGVMNYSPIFGWLSLKNDDDLKKFGFVISKKISKKAVERNKIKRRLAESIKKYLDDFEKGIRIVFLAKKEILNKSIKEIEDEIKKCLEK
ncbi:Ribonuclease P protein component [bioreactor metagenome]|uniref:Ribonuclease P protein component n=1 Tax=bioreactor metagenome TaxID=1076179 RepID=A0A644ZV70_9ZZZZ